MGRSAPLRCIRFMRMPRNVRDAVATAALSGAALVAGCGDMARLPVEAGTGPEPSLPEPNESVIPTVNIAPARGWPEGAKPTAAEGMVVTPFVAQLEHPRWLYVLPNGDVLVAETNAPPKPED